MTTLKTPPAHAKSRHSIAADAILLIADLQSGIADLPLTVPATTQASSSSLGQTDSPRRS
jgi:hypothetical protein